MRVLLQLHQHVPAPTLWPGVTFTVLTTPAIDVRMLCSIFMVSRTHTSSPADTVCPSSTETRTMRPGMGALMVVSVALAEMPEVLRGRRFLAGWPGAPTGFSISTSKVSPSMETSTGEVETSPTSTEYQRSFTLTRMVVTGAYSTEVESS